MNKSILKNFATAARIRLMDDVRYRLGLMGITAKGIAAPLHQAPDMAEYEYAKGQTYRLLGADVAARGVLADMVRVRGFEQVAEEVAYTWFNRLIAIRFMEVNGYLPSHTRVLSSATSGQSTPDIVTRALDIDLGLSEAEKQQVLAWKLDNQTDELFRFLFLKQCRQLAGLLPGLFDTPGTFHHSSLSSAHPSPTDHLSLLLTISCVNPDGIVAELLKIPESYFNVHAVDEEGQPTGQVEIIGWMYQYYNAELKDDTFAKLKQNIKITKERIPSATQLFTPQWIVKYMTENSLGRLWVEKLMADGDTRSETEIAKAFGWRYYLPEAEQTPEVAARLKALRAERRIQSPEDLRFMDPCMGSGHILVYAFDLLMQLYLSRGYSAADAARRIVENNLWGLDIDDRAWQLAYFAVMMKARQYNPQALRLSLHCNLHAVQDSQGLDAKQLDYFGKGLSQLERNTAKGQAEALLELFKEGKLLGSIIRVPDWDFALLKRFADDFTLPRQVDILSDLHAEGVQPRLKELVAIAGALNLRYEAVVTNPPYMGSSGMNAALYSYVKEEYPNSKSDLFAVFIERCGEMLRRDGYQAMITQHAWMFLSSFEKLRTKLLKKEIINMAHLGARAFEEIGGEVVQTTAFVLSEHTRNKYQGNYSRLVESTNQEGKEIVFLSGINHFTADQRRYRIIPGAPIAYWISSKYTKIFTEKKMSDFGMSCIGMRTGDNERFLRLWHEVCRDSTGFGYINALQAQQSKKKWYPYCKGGTFRKWYGNNEYLVNWEDDGAEIKENTKKIYPYLGDNLGWKISNEQYYFQPGLTWSGVGARIFGVRYYSFGMIFDSGANSFFVKDKQYNYYFAGLLNCIVIDNTINIVNPTINTGSGLIAQLPARVSEVKKGTINSLVIDCIRISQADWDSFEASWDFIGHPMV